MLGRLQVPLPRLETQNRRVEALRAQLSIVDAVRSGAQKAENRTRALRRAILDRAFRGELVAQDPSDEPATALLERIRAERAASAPARRRQGRSSVRASR